MAFRIRRIGVLLLFAPGFVACATSGGGSAPPVRFEKPAPGADPFPNWPMHPEQAYDLLPTAPFEIREVSLGVGGTSGARQAELRFPSVDQDVRLKTKPMPPSLDGINNAPRKELAAYVIQRLFLDPEDYVVPTTLARCVSIEKLRAYFQARPQIPGATCRLGVGALWLEDVTVPDVLYDEERFRTDPVYAYFAANWNLFTYLIDHRDGRSGNFLVSTDDARRQVFSIDNGVAFGPTWPFYNWFVPNWNDIKVPALRKESVDRLRNVQPGDLDFLGVVAHFELDADGMLNPVPPGANLDPDEGVRVKDGTVQLGLTEDEIEDVYERIEELIEEVDEGDIPVS